MKWCSRVRKLEKAARPKQGGIVMAWEEEDGTYTYNGGWLRDGDKGRNVTAGQLDQEYPGAMLFTGGRDCKLMYV